MTINNIAILGSTGSIGTNSLRVIEALGEGYNVWAITANTKVEMLAEQARKYEPAVVAIADESKYAELKSLLPGFKGQVLAGTQSLIEVSTASEVDTVITAIVGAAGLPATIEAAKKGKRLAIANKEPLVVAGKFLTRAAKENGAEILPVDSEHSAVFQAMLAGRADEVAKVILTASGGPFRNASKDDIKNASLEEALNHPTWDMGPKITIDSATMVNKALEVIEARWLFDLDVDKIDVLIHPESIIHSMVEYVDGSVIAQLGTPDMCTPIQYALTYPSRAEGISTRIDFSNMRSLNFQEPDFEIFRGLKLGFDSLKCADSMPVVFNAANEAAVAEFLAGKIKFYQITELIERTMDGHEPIEVMGLDQLFEIDCWARCDVVDKMQCLK